MDFKQRVHHSIISGADIFKSVFLGYEYLLYNPDFKYYPYYIISANEDNYAHLTGVHSLVSAQEFFNKCYDGTIQESEFDFMNQRILKNRQKTLAMSNKLCYAWGNRSFG